MAFDGFNTLLNVGTYLNTDKTNKNLQGIQDQIATLSQQAANAQSQQDVIESKRQVVFEYRKALEELYSYADHEPVEALREMVGYINGRLKRIHESDFPDFQDKEYVHKVKQYYVEVINRIQDILGVDKVNNVLEWMDNIDYSFTIACYTAALRSEKLARKKGLFNKGKITKEIISINKQYNIDENTARFHIEASTHVFNSEILPFLIKRIQNDNLEQILNRAIINVSPDELDRILEYFEQRAQDLVEPLRVIGFLA